MKKKFIYTFLMILSIFMLTGCFEGDNLNSSKITTTVYPIEYLIARLTNNESSSTNITSIYPKDTVVSEYKLTDKQINDFSKKTDLFIYNGLSDEKDIAKKLINKNKRMQIIDASYGIKYSYGIEELWLNPNDYIMLASTIKGDLQELSSSKYTAEKIENNYALLEEDLSLLDAELRSIASSAIKNGKDTIVVAYDAFGFLEEYGFKVVNISSENNITTSVKNKFKNKTYTHIFVRDKANVADSIKDLVDNYEAVLVEVNTMETLTEKQKMDNDNYLTIMNDFITDISNIVLS